MSNYNVKSLKAEEFISDSEILETIKYAEENKNNIELIESILEKARPKKTENGTVCAGLNHREASVLLACENEEIIGAINVEKAFDWILYCQGRGIDAFVAEKTDCRGLEGFVPGASKTYEFARFERLHNEEQRRKQAIEKERLQQEFKQSFMKELAVGLAQQQIENNSANVLDIVSSLFQKENYSNAIEKILDNHLLEKQQENLIDERVKVYDKVEQTREVSQKLLTDNSNNYANAFFQFVKQQNEHQR